MSAGDNSSDDENYAHIPPQLPARPASVSNMRSHGTNLKTCTPDQHHSTPYGTFMGPMLDLLHKDLAGYVCYALGRTQLTGTLVGELLEYFCFNVTSFISRVRDLNRKLQST